MRLLHDASNSPDRAEEFGENREMGDEKTELAENSVEMGGLAQRRRKVVRKCKAGSSSESDHCRCEEYLALSLVQHIVLHITLNRRHRWFRISGCLAW